MVSKNFKSLKYLLLIFVILTSCQSAPRVPDVFTESANHAPLNTGASVYIFADVKKARPIIDMLPINELQDKQTAQMLDRTDFFTAALFPAASGKRFQLTAWGNYPNSQANFAFSIDKNWQKHNNDTGLSFWHSSANGLSIAMTSKQAFVVSSLNETITDPFPAIPGVEIPDGFGIFRHGNSNFPLSPLALWINNPGPAVTRLFNEIGIPVRSAVHEVFICFLPEDSRYKARIMLRMENASHARGMASIINIAGGLLNNGSEIPVASIFLANPVIQDGRDLFFLSAPLGENELTLLFMMFSLY